MNTNKSKEIEISLKNEEDEILLENKDEYQNNHFQEEIINENLLEFPKKKRQKYYKKIYKITFSFSIFYF